MNKTIKDPVSGIYTFSEVHEEHAVLPQEGDPENPDPADPSVHMAQTVIPTKSLDLEGNLYLILAGGYYGDKHGPSQHEDRYDHLRILEFIPDQPEPGKFKFEAHDEFDITGDGVFNSSDLAVMMDIDLMRWNADNLLDILISTEDKGPILLHNITSSSSDPEFDVASVFPSYAQGVRTFGAGVGDFDQNGKDDFILLLFEPENSPPRIPVIMENGYPSEFIKHDILWLKDPDPNPLAGNPYRDTYRVLANRRSYEAVVVELENHADTIIVAAELPYYLIKDFWPPTSPFQFHEWTLERSYEDLPIPTLSGPLLKAYTSLDLVVTDLTGDGEEDILLSDEAEQNRLWAAYYDEGVTGNFSINPGNGA